MKTSEFKGKILSAWDWDGKVRVQYKDTTGRAKNTTIEDAAWYFAVKFKDFSRLNLAELKQYTMNGVISKLYRHGEYVKIYCKKDNSQILVDYMTSKGVQCFESDLPAYKRWMTDTNAEIETNISILFFDIETDDSQGGIEIGRDRIISWAGYDQDGNSFYFTDSDEEKVLQSFTKVLDCYDLYTGWNSTNFDKEYIRKRMDFHQMRYEWRKKIHVDLMQRCIKLYSYDMDKIGLTGFSLDEVSRVFLGERKIQHTEKIFELERDNPDLLKRYNLKDAELLYKLNKKLDIIPLMVKECEVTGTLMTHFYIGELLDNYMLRESKKLDMFLPSAPSLLELEENKEVDIIGGFVHEPKTGLYDEVNVLDFASLYPSIIVGWNIGEDVLNVQLSEDGDKAFDAFVKTSSCCRALIEVTKEKKILKRKVNGVLSDTEVMRKKLKCTACGNEKAVYRKIEEIPFTEWFDFLMSEKKRLDPSDKHFQTANNNFFAKDKKSFISGLVENFLKLRKQYKSEMKKYEPGSAEFGNARSMQAVIKEMANSMFGITGDKRSRYFNKHISEGITLSGQFLNKTSSHILEHDMKYPVIYGDTDSIFTPMPGILDVEPIIEELNTRLKDKMLSSFGLQNYIISLDSDKKYKRMIMIDKKKYTGILETFGGQNTDMKFSKGTEDIKKNTISFTRKKMSDVIMMITRDRKTADDIEKWVKETKEYFMSTDELKAEDISISIKISKATKDYSSEPVHVQIARRLISEGKMAEPVSTRRSWNLIQYIITNGQGKNEAVHIDEFAGVWDRIYYWNTQFYAPIERLLKAAFPDRNWEQYEIIPEKIPRKPRAKKVKSEKTVDSSDAVAPKWIQKSLFD